MGRGCAGWCAVMMSLALGAPVRAEFDVPDSCRAGTGTYTGSLEGTCSYSTCVRDFGEVVSLAFAGDFPREYTDNEDNGSLAFLHTAIDDDGTFTLDFGSGADPNENRVHIEALFSECGITGTWELTDNEGGDFSGTFTIMGTGPGPLCDETTAGDCGAAGCGGMGFMLPLAGAMLVQYRVRRPVGRRRCGG